MVMTPAAENRQRGAVLVVGGTHGNERNGAWLLEAWRRGACRLACHGLAVRAVIGNPDALAANRRYLDHDLNRSFSPDRLAAGDTGDRETVRARQLLARHGPDGAEPALVAIDLHSTTAAMGNSLVVYGRRPADLALAAAVQQRLGLPVYLHEGDPAQTGYLCERWPCGLVIEVGPVGQGLLDGAIVRQTRLALEETLAVLAAAARRELRLPPQLVVHRHRCTVDLPRHGDGLPAAVLHPCRQGRDWQPIHSGDPLFAGPDGEVGGTDAGAPGLPQGMATAWPVFINEAAYEEKGIALALTQREVWPTASDWAEALAHLAQRLERDQRGGPL
ncbi:MAG: aspartoacylase [Cyanobacteriota bacterium]|nr:aspartoacylase [Cyanobacteriota bacterium]